MKLFGRFFLPSLLIVAASATFASDGIGPSGSSTGSSDNGDITKLKEYLHNLGSYFGYDLTTDPTQTQAGDKKPVHQTLLNSDPDPTKPPLIQLINKVAFDSFLGGSFIVNAVPAIADVVANATGDQYPSYINPRASFSLNPPDGIYKSMSYLNPSQTGVSVSQLIDQPPYQADPVNQAVLNILGTPDYSYCMGGDNEKDWLGTCLYNKGSNLSSPIMNEFQVMANTIGTPLPGTDAYFTYAQTQPLLGQLNANSLVTPLMYSKTPLQQTQQQTGGGVTPGLIAMSQEQQAANFIRFVSGAVTPMALPDRAVYDGWLLKANAAVDTVQKKQAQAVISSYLTSIRVYAAQVSIGLSNLYYIMSKRLQQGGGTNPATSQALSEFTMATWRLQDPNKQPENQWVTQINNASPATIQKEMVVLLAEINYQLYLNRQQEERMLLTNSLLLLQNAKAAQPSPQLNPPSTGFGSQQ